MSWEPGLYRDDNGDFRIDDTVAPAEDAEPEFDPFDVSVRNSYVHTSCLLEVLSFALGCGLLLVVLLNSG